MIINRAEAYNPLLLDKETREKVWEMVLERGESYYDQVRTVRITPAIDPERLRRDLKAFDLENGGSALQVTDFIFTRLKDSNIQCQSPSYFGLHNPVVGSMGIVAEALVAAFNPELAVWSHSPFAVEVEGYLINLFGRKFGYDEGSIDGCFTNGASEANHTALLTALTRRFPSFIVQGIKSIPNQPAFYISEQGHHSFIKAAKFCGLGTESVRRIPVMDDLTMNVEVLRQGILTDLKNGLAPFLVVSTAGTTSSGSIDHLLEISAVASEFGLWNHVDASFGGAIALIDDMSVLIDGIERSDSITFDAHKFLSVPLGAGMFITRHRDILRETCSADASYLPMDTKGADVTDPFAHSLQWSRRFAGLKVFMSLAVAGWRGYEEVLSHQMALGEYLKESLRKADWTVLNDSRLPVVNFSKSNLTVEDMNLICHEVVSSGKSWISIARIDEVQYAIRACVTNFNSNKEDIDSLIRCLEESADKIWLRQNRVPEF